jgi:chromosome segregation ATPase
MDDDGATQIHQVSQIRAFSEDEAELEVNDDTVEFEAPNFTQAASDDAAAALEDELAERDKSIGELKLALEQLESGKSEIDNELRERESRAEQLQEELRQIKRRLTRRDKSLESTRARLLTQKKKLRGAKAELADRQAAVEALEQRAQEAERQAQSSDNEEIANLRAALEEANSKNDEIEGLRSVALADATEKDGEIEKLRASLEASETNHKESEGLRRAALEDATEKDGEIDKLRGALDKAMAKDDEIQRLRAELEEASKKNRAMDSLRAELEDANKHSEYVNAENARLLADLAAKSSVVARHEEESNSQISNLLIGKHAAAVQEIKDLRNQIVRTERYADEIRHKLKSHIDSSEEAQTAREEMAAMLDEERQRASELKKNFDSERLAHTELSLEFEEMKRSFELELNQIRADHDQTREEHKQELEKRERHLEDELSKLRFELTTAQETITDHELTNEQLTANLLSNKNSANSLEEQLSEIESRHEEEMHDLEREVKQLREANEELERKLENKDSAIADMMSELASRSHADESGDRHSEGEEIELSSTPERSKRNAAESRPRVSRLLIGNMDGQELRFPLFKDRLTIGRTADNDIQLETRYISRRHAVIVTEGDETRIVDWGSKNGIRVNREFVKEQFLHSGDVVTIGTADFRYEERSKR